MSEPTTPNAVEPLDLPLVTRLAKTLKQPIVFLDLETTTNIVSSPEFGVTEIAYLAVFPNGKQSRFVALVNPENPISSRASEITGITQAMVSEAPTFAEHAKRLTDVFNASVVVTYNGDTFDVPGVLTQMDRYGAARPTNCQSLDAYKAWKKIQNVKGGKLIDVCQHYGVTLDGAHRALADVFATAEVFEQMLWQHGANFAIQMANEAYDPSSPESKKPSASSKELTATQTALKGVIDKLTAAPIAVADFAARLRESGYELEITKGGAAYIHAETKERTGGSLFGSDYSWAKVSAKLTGETPPELVKGVVYGGNGGARSASSAGSSSGSSYGSPASSADRANEERRAREAILALAAEGKSVDPRAAMQKAGLSKVATVSITMGNMLVEGTLSPEAAERADAQEWLGSRIERLLGSLPDRKLKPLLAAAQAEKCPDCVDYVQLRVAVMRFELAKGLAPAARSAPMARPAQAPARAPAPAAAPAPSEPPNFDDCPFDSDFDGAFGAAPFDSAGFDSMGSEAPPSAPSGPRM